jgi:hypothetical protein
VGPLRADGGEPLGRVAAAAKPSLPAPPVSVRARRGGTGPARALA